VASVVAVAALVASVVPVAAMGDRSPGIAGSPCSRTGQTRSVGRTSFVCVASGARRVWRRVQTAAAGASSNTTTTTMPVASSGDLVAASQCRLTDPRAATEGISLGHPRPAVRLKATGTVRIGVVFVDFPDAVATRTTQSVLDLISPAAEQRFAAFSYGRATFELVPVHRWVRMSRASTAYGMRRSQASFSAHRAYVAEALDLGARSLGVGGLDGFLVLANPDAAALDFGPAFTPNDGYWAAVAAGRSWTNGATSGTDLLGWRSAWFNHEFGHVLGLVDLYAFDGEQHRFTGGFSLMGEVDGAAPEYFAWERWTLGWLTNAEVACIESGSATVTLDPIERAGGTKMLVARLGPSRAVVVESRRRLGYDTALAREGALVYLVDTSVASGKGPIRVQPENDADLVKSSALLRTGDSIIVAGVRISVVASGSSGDRVTMRTG
jgi:M6 family metalloprotease-like protein